MVMGFLFGWWRRALAIFFAARRQQNRILVGDLNPKREPLRERDRSKMRPETGPALSALRSEFEKAVSSQEGKKFSSVVREPPVLIVNKNKYKQGYPREGSNKRGRLTHTSIQ